MSLPLSVTRPQRSQTNTNSFHGIRDNKDDFDDTASYVFVIVLIKIGYTMFPQNDRKKERKISEIIDSLALFCS